MQTAAFYAALADALAHDPGVKAEVNVYDHIRLYTGTGLAPHCPLTYVAVRHGYAVAHSAQYRAAAFHLDLAQPLASRIANAADDREGCARTTRQKLLAIIAPYL